MKKTYTGSCHCGAVRFECDLDLHGDPDGNNGTSKCNCSVCAKGRFWKAVISADAFRLLKGEAELTEYLFGSETIRHLFCSRCGIKPFGRGRLEDFGDFVAINVATLDDASDEELATAPVQYEDGRNDRWDAAPVETRYL